MTDLESSFTGALAGSPLALPIFTWCRYNSQTNDLVEATRQGIGAVLVGPSLVRFNPEIQPDKIAAIDRYAEMARREYDSDYATLHAHSLLGLWGAFECMIEDIFIASIASNEALLLGDSFVKMKLPISVAFSKDSQARYQAVLFEATRRVAEAAEGVSRHEALLNLVGLSGRVPPELGRQVYQAQQIRNVWAHRGGSADERFARACPDLGFRVGDQVSISTSTFEHLVGALRKYSGLIVNRHLAALGRTPVDLESADWIYRLFFTPEQDESAPHP